MNAPVMTITELAAAWIQAKAAEETAKQNRLDIESSMFGLLPRKDEGTASIEDAGMKITVTHKLTRKVDSDALRAAWNTLPEHAQACFKWGADISIKELRACEAMDADAYAFASRFITAKLAKPSIAVEVKQ